MHAAALWLAFAGQEATHLSTGLWPVASSVTDPNFKAVCVCVCWSALSGAKPLPVVKLVDNFDASWDYVANDGEAFTLKTNLDAPRYRCVQQPS